MVLAFSIRPGTSRSEFGGMERRAISVGEVRNNEPRKNVSLGETVTAEGGLVKAELYGVCAPILGGPKGQPV